MTNHRVILAAALAVACPAAARAQAAYPWHDRVQPSVTTQSSLDMASRDWVYAYTVSNGAGAEQRINTFLVPLTVPASAVSAPASWTALHEPGAPHALWFADGEVDPAWVPTSDGDIASFLSEIAPGGSLGGFELRSPCAPVAAAGYLAQGYNHMRSADDDTVPGQVPPDTPADAVAGTAYGPSDCSVVLDWGSVKAASDGFMGVVNFAPGATLQAPAIVQIRFSRSGEVVNVPTFRAQLNRRDVTASFARNSHGDLVAVFSPGSSPAVRGENQLQISVSGIVTATGRSATDTQKTTFIIP